MALYPRVPVRGSRNMYVLKINLLGEGVFPSFALLFLLLFCLVRFHRVDIIKKIVLQPHGPVFFPATRYPSILFGGFPFIWLRQPAGVLSMFLFDIRVEKGC